MTGQWREGPDECEIGDYFEVEVRDTDTGEVVKDAVPAVPEIWELEDGRTFKLEALDGLPGDWIYRRVDPNDIEDPPDDPGQKLRLTHCKVGEWVTVIEMEDSGETAPADGKVVMPDGTVARFQQTKKYFLHVDFDVWERVE